MCGRYVSPDEAAIEREWHIGRHNNNPFKRRFNVGPTALVPLLRLDPVTGELELTLARWGLIPQWWKEDKPPRMTHNARMEEAASKPMWRQVLRHGRCLIPAEGWYEWQETQRIDPATGEIAVVKQPHFLYLPGGRLFCFAGVMALWTHAGENNPVLTCAVFTKEADASIADVHSRMPVVLPPESHAAWLDPVVTDGPGATTLLKQHARGDFVHHAVSTRVNSTRNDDEALIERVDIPTGS